MAKTRHILLTAAIGAICILGGCFKSEKFTKPNYDTIYVGQYAPDVLETLGQPTQQTQYVWTWIHQRPYYKACIKVDQGRVIGKNWTYDKEGEASTMPSITSKPAGKSRTIPF